VARLPSTNYTSRQTLIADKWVSRILDTSFQLQRNINRNEVGAGRQAHACGVSSRDTGPWMWIVLIARTIPTVPGPRSQCAGYGVITPLGEEAPGKPSDDHVTHRRPCPHTEAVQDMFAWVIKINNKLLQRYIW